MSGLDGKQFVVIHVRSPHDEADFFGRLFDAPGIVIDDGGRQVDTGSYVIRIMPAMNEKEITEGLRLEVNVNSVNQFAEDVWNRGIKYSSRPQNNSDGLRRVGFVSPGEIRVIGVGPPKIDSTGAFPVFR
jgi:hypothetical protein